MNDDRLKVGHITSYDFMRILYGTLLYHQFFYFFISDVCEILIIVLKLELCV